MSDANKWLFPPKYRIVLSLPPAPSPPVPYSECSRIAIVLPVPQASIEACPVCPRCPRLRIYDEYRIQDHLIVSTAECFPRATCKAVESFRCPCSSIARRKDVYKSNGKVAKAHQWPGAHPSHLSCRRIRGWRNRPTLPQSSCVQKLQRCGTSAAPRARHGLAPSLREWWRGNA